MEITFPSPAHAGVLPHSQVSPRLVRGFLEVPMLPEHSPTLTRCLRTGATAHVYGGRALAGLLKNPVRLQEALALVDSTPWTGFDDILVAVCIGERVAGVTSVMEYGGELLFVVDLPCRGFGLGLMMIETLVEHADLKHEEVTAEGYVPPYVAVTGSPSGEALLRGAFSRFGWRMAGLISWLGHEREWPTS